MSLCLIICHLHTYHLSCLFLLIMNTLQWQLLQDQKNYYKIKRNRYSSFRTHSTWYGLLPIHVDGNTWKQCRTWRRGTVSTGLRQSSQIHPSKIKIPAAILTLETYDRKWKYNNITIIIKKIDAIFATVTWVCILLNFHRIYVFHNYTNNEIICNVFYLKEVAVRFQEKSCFLLKVWPRSNLASCRVSSIYINIMQSSSY